MGRIKLKELEEKIRQKEKKIKQMKARLTREKRKRREKALRELGELLMKTGVEREGLLCVLKSEVKRILEKYELTEEDI
jgi:uncharacterized protein YlxW (UPF0749 family)